MDHTRYPWDLTRVPNYQSAPTVEVVNAEDLDERTFQRRYVSRNLPCLIKRAAVGWPAFSRWSDPEYLASKVGDFEIRASRSPKIEAFGLRSFKRDSLAMQTTRDRRLPAQKVRDLLPRLHTPDDEVLFIELHPTEAGVRCLGDDLLADGARLPFLPSPPPPRFMYSGWGVMVYKNSYSDWHFHPGTEAIMCQVLGTKDVLLLPPTRRSWDQIVPIHDHDMKVYDVDVARSPAYRDIRPYHVVVAPGDGLFLPVNWWHAVQARPREVGITVPVAWNSGYRDLRQPATRHFLRVLWRRHKPLAPLALLRCACATVTHQVREQLVDR